MDRQSFIVACFLHKEVNMIKRGDIYYADLGNRYLCEQGGIRPVVILQNDKGNAHSPTTIVAPITSKMKNKKMMPTHLMIRYRNLYTNSIILFEQIRTIDKSRLGQYICHMRNEDIEKLDSMIMVSIGEKI